MIFARCGLPTLYLLAAEIQLSLSLSLTKTFNPPQKNNHQNISTLLDNLLRGYDNSIRPDFGGNYLGRFLIKLAERRLPRPAFCFFAGPPAIVEVDIMVRSMGPISEVDMVSSCFS